MNRVLRKILITSTSLLLFAGVNTSIHFIHVNASNVNFRITHQINHMSWRQKIGQMFIGDGLSNNTRQNKHLVHHYNLGGVILDSNNINGGTKYRDSQMQRATHHSLLIGTDQEGGEVSRLGYNPSRYPSPREAYHRGGMHGIKHAYAYSAYELHKRGINWNYAPDADVATPGSYMYFRALGKGPRKTAQYVKNAVHAIQGQHVAATLKHFPGYGSESQDTDYDTVRTNRSLSHMEHYDFIPFKAGIHAGADSVMVTNIILNKVQRGVPATLSHRDISLLRNKLHFHGVIVTDSLNAVAVQNYCRRHNILGAFLAIKAGNDMIMSTNFRHDIPVLTKCVEEGLLSKRQVNASVYRILMMKHKLGLNY